MAVKGLIPKGLLQDVRSLIAEARVRMLRGWGTG